MTLHKNRPGCVHESGECQSGPYCAHHGACRLSRRLPPVESRAAVRAAERDPAQLAMDVAAARVPDAARKLRLVTHSEANHDAVNHPSHYTQGGIECIDALESALGPEAFINYCRANAIKYLWRMGRKDATEQEMRKAIWYITRAIATLPKGPDEGPAVIRKAAA